MSITANPTTDPIVTDITTNMNFSRTYRVEGTEFNDGAATDVAIFSASYSTFGNANFNLSVSHLPLYLEYEESVKDSFETFKTEVTAIIKRVLNVSDVEVDA